jgi:hypothetical protein
MKTLTLTNGTINFQINDDEITIDNIKVYEQRKGTGRQLIEMVKDIARDLQLPIGLYAEPQDSTINSDDLINFYYLCGFELDPNDSDGKLFIWNN